MSWERFDPNGMPAPSLDLPAVGEGELGIHDFRGWASLLPFFSHGPTCQGCQAVFACLAEKERELELARAEAVIVLPAAPGNALEIPTHRRLHWLIDAQQALRQAYALMLPGTSDAEAMLFVLDQYGVPWAGWHGAEPSAGLCQEGIEWLEFIAVQCPE